MKFSKSLIPRIFLILFIYQIFFNVPKAQSAEKIKIIYSIFSRTVTVDSLKTFAENGNSSKSLRKILNATGSSDEKRRQKWVYFTLAEIFVASGWNRNSARPSW